MTLNNAEKIMNYFLITQGLKIQEIRKVKSFLLLYPYGVIDKDIPYQDQTISTSLYLRGKNITDISFLKNLTELTYLNLGYSDHYGNETYYGNDISDLSPIKNLTQLTELDLHLSDITDISFLQNLKKLKSLSLTANNITDVSPLQSLTNLTYLCLGTNKIIDISPLQNLPNLNHLRLFGNKIEDISPLQKLTQLKDLFLDSAQVTAELQKALPNCRIVCRY